jgi:hypothetical protein
MKRIFIMLMALGLVFQIARPALPADNKAILGSWKCTVTDVPYEYSNSIITIAEKEGKLAGTVKFDNGSEVKISTLKYTNNQLTISLFVEGNEVIVDGKVEENKMAGSADTPNGRVTFTASRIIEKGK